MNKKKIPLRKCLISREQFPKHELTRIVNNKELGIQVDKTGKLNGRGAYLYLSKENIEKACKRKILEREFKVDDLGSIYDELLSMLDE